MGTQGFTRQQLAALQHIKSDLEKNFTYSTESKTEKTKEYHVSDYWESDEVLKSAVDHSIAFSGECQTYAMVGLRKAIEAGMTGRLLVCYDELKQGHCIAEIKSDDDTEAYYIDNRRHGLATQQGLVGYYFIGGSPWNPIPGDTRPWVLINQEAA